MNKLSVAHLSAISVPPPALIEAAATAGFAGVGLRLLRVTPDSPGYPLMDDPQMRRATQAALRATGLRVSDIEFVRLTPDFNVEAVHRFLDCGAELGARHVIAAPYDDDHLQLVENLARLSDAARARGLTVVLEFFPWTSVPDLSACWKIVSRAGSDVGILVDMLHFDRSGSSCADLSALPPDRLPFAHLCDAPVAPPYTTEQLLHTAREARLAPGQGAIRIEEILAALPPGIPLTIEVPRHKSRAGQTTESWLKTLHEAAAPFVRGR